ncbi:MAG: hypothetical protein ACI9FJ_000582 [Alteromonadaceae bacterium]|jgi:hypothetical protein
MRDIYILHENSEWVVPLRAAFKALGVEAKEWFLDDGEIAFDQIPPDGIFYNRMSASSHTRGHRFGPEYARMALTWLESNNRRVVNTTDALYLEVCKVSQYAALQHAGVKTPATRPVVGKQHLLGSADSFNHWPLILKPNRGGKGLGVQLFQSQQALESYINSDEYEEPLDGIWLLQQYIQPQASFITRCEFVGGKYIYAVNVNTEQGFELCPADVCAVDDSFCPTTEQPVNKFKISTEFDNHPVIAKLENMLANSGIEVAGIEIIRDADGEIYAYDINTNTNYNSQAEAEANVAKTGMGSIAKFLSDLAKA